MQQAKQNKTQFIWCERRESRRPKAVCEAAVSAKKPGKCRKCPWWKKAKAAEGKHG